MARMGKWLLFAAVCLAAAVAEPATGVADAEPAGAEAKKASGAKAAAEKTHVVEEKSKPKAEEPKAQPKAEEPKVETTAGTATTEGDEPFDMTYAAAGAVVVGALGALAMFSGKSGSGKGKVSKTNVALVGLPNSGKTALFYRITRGQEVETQTSMIPNEEKVQLPSGKARTLVDYPGHLKLRNAAQPTVHAASVIVYCVDAIDWEMNLSSNAEYLVDLLTDPKIILTSPKTHLAIACTKRDAGHSYKSTTVQKQLEAEIDKVRKTKVQGVAAIGAQEETIHLGVEGEKFKFADHSPLPTRVFDVGSDKAQWGPLWDWVSEVA